MGMANGGKPGGGVNGKYNEMARMAMSHPAFLNQVISIDVFCTFLYLNKYPTDILQTGRAEAPGCLRKSLTVRGEKASFEIS